MKQAIFILSILFITNVLLAQDQSKYQKAMAATLEKMGEAKSAEDYQSVTNKFLRIADNETEQWAPLYYAAFIKTFRAYEAKDKAAASRELELLTPKVEELTKLGAVLDNPKIASEIHTLLAMMYSARMMENPMTLGSKFMPLNAQHLSQAEKLNNENPRVYLLQAQNLFYTPEAFGGDKAKAKILAQKAIELFNNEAETERDNFAPRWGKVQADGLLKQME